MTGTQGNEGNKGIVGTYALPGLLFLARGGLLFDGENFFARVMSAVRADVMRQTHLVAIRARRQVYDFHREMTAAAVATSFRYFSLW